MIELAFGESIAASLMIAKSLKPGDTLKGDIGVSGGTRKEQRRLLRQAKSHVWTGDEMEGSSQDVIRLYLALDIGELNQDEIRHGRGGFLNALFGGYPGSLERLWEKNQSHWERLQQALRAREPVRVWAGEQDPADQCAFCMVCSMAKQADAPLSVVRLPVAEEREGAYLLYHGADEFAAESLGAFGKRQEQVSPVQQNAFAALWDQLVRENAPLRAMVNGRLLSVPEDFYDFAIRAHLPDTPTYMAHVLGKVLAQLPGVRDRWIFRRMQRMIQSGELEVVEPDQEDHPYSALVRRRQR